LQAQGIDNQVPVVFNPAGDFGSLVNDQVVAPTGNRVMSWGRLGAIGMCLATVEKIKVKPDQKFSPVVANKRSHPGN